MNNLIMSNKKKNLIKLEKLLEGFFYIPLISIYFCIDFHIINVCRHFSSEYELIIWREMSECDLKGSGM